MPTLSGAQPTSLGGVENVGPDPKRYFATADYCTAKASFALAVGLTAHLRLGEVHVLSATNFIDPRVAFCRFDCAGGYHGLQ